MPRNAFVRDGETVDLDLGDDLGVIVLKAEMSVEDRSLISQASVTGKIKTSKNSKEVELGQLDAGASVIQSLILNIKGWHGPQFDGVPLTPQNILKLTDSISREISNKVEELNPEPNSQGNPTNGSASTS